MAAAMVCGNKRSYFEEEWESMQVVTKKLRCGFSPLDSVTKSLDQMHLPHGNSGHSATTATTEEHAQNSKAHGNTYCYQQQIEALMREKVALKEQNTILISKEKEHVVLKEQYEAVIRENVVLQKQVNVLTVGVLATREHVKDLTKKLEDSEKKVSYLQLMVHRLQRDFAKKEVQKGNSMPGRRHCGMF